MCLRPVLVEQTNAQGEPAMKPHWEISRARNGEMYEAAWSSANRDYFRGGGFSSNFLSKGGMPVTMTRLNLVKGLGPVLQIAEGWTVEIDPEVHKLLDHKHTDHIGLLLGLCPVFAINRHLKMCTGNE